MWHSAEASRIAAEAAIREALLRGAKGELQPAVTLQGNTHDGRGAGSLAYGGAAVAEVRYSHVK